MNDPHPSRRPGLFLFTLLCLALLVPAVLAWLVNVEAALQAIAETVRLPLPSVVRESFQPLAADLSTISTLVPLLLLAYPVVIGLRLRARTDLPSPSGQDAGYDPYPPHFPFFLIMLGLAGTLYGLYIGLDVSGVQNLGTTLPTPEAIQETLDQLLAGTATALLSSLVGLIGAFVAARPIPWLFALAAGQKEEPPPVRLSETLAVLNQDLAALGESARAMQESLQRVGPGSLSDTLRGVNEGIDLLHTDTLRQTEVLQEFAKQQTTLAHRLEPLAELHRLGAIESRLEQQHEVLRESVALLTRAVDAQDRHAAAVEASMERIAEGQNAMCGDLHQLLEADRAARARSTADRNALRRALKGMLDDDGSR